MKKILIIGAIFAVIFLIDSGLNTNFFNNLINIHAEEILDGFVCDFFTASLLFCTAILSGVIFIIIRKSNFNKNQNNNAWLFVSGIFFWAYLDEIFDIHCIFEYWKPTKIFEELIPIGYFLVGLIFLAYFYKHLKQNRLKTPFLIIGLIFQFFGSFDIHYSIEWPQEAFEFLAALMYFQFVGASLKHYLEEIIPQEPRKEQENRL